MKFQLIVGLPCVALVALLGCRDVVAQTANPFVEEFTGTATSNSWYFYDGACLTAGSGTGTHSPGQIPGCKSVLSSYYHNQSNADAALVGGQKGYLGSAVAPSGPSQQTPDASGSGALRFTNGYPYGANETGAIISANPFPSSGGVQITFKTVTYRGTTVDYKGKGGAADGADGISFFLMDGATDLTRFVGVGAFGGSLGYSCSDLNFDPTPRTAGEPRGFDGLVGGVLGIGVDEFGNYLNGTNITLGTPGAAPAPDNTASGLGYLPNAIGLRGAGSVSWATLNGAYSRNPGSLSKPYYPTSLASSCPAGTGTLDSERGYCASCSVGSYNSTNATCSNGGVLTANPTYAALAVKHTCRMGELFNYTDPANPVSAGTTSLSNTNNAAHILDYAAIGGTPLSNLGPSFQIANESAVTRADATPITYQLHITSNNLLSFSFSYNGGTYQPVVADRDLAAAVGAIPASLRFGFAGSTGGSTNIHEILCFQAQPDTTSGSSTSVSSYENPVVAAGTTQLFLAYYTPDNWSGRVTAQSVYFDSGSNAVAVSATPSWDAGCVLTGVTAATGPCSTGVTSLAPQEPGNRTMLTWNGSQGVPFEWSDLTAAQRAALDLNDATQGNTQRLEYLRGDRSQEINTQGVGTFRPRRGVLGDIIDSSPVWVGPPQTYNSSVTWVDQLYPDATVPEAAGQTYAAFETQQQGRLNVVYVGANDGFVHGFRAGSLNATGTLVNNAATPNDGAEVLAYMPGAVLESAAWSSSASPTQSLVQNIHGVIPATPPATGSTLNPSLDYSNPQYGHNYFIDATPATGDLYTKGQWRTWLVGGLGAGGAALYALDVTSPSSFSEGTAANTVVGEWHADTLQCVNVTSCGTYLGNTYGTPIIRRFHNGAWGVVFGNGFGAVNGAAGIYILLVDPVSGARTFYYLAVPNQGGANGIASATSLDLDGDHIVDYLYAGDLLGNIWRFDVTSQNPVQWGVSVSSPLFNAGQPITTALVIGTRRTVVADSTHAGLSFSSAPERVVLDFGTGQQIPQTATAAIQYATGTQYLFGVWDWDMGGWNKLSSSQQAVSLSGTQSVTLSSLQQQTIMTNTSTSPATRMVSTVPVCWKGITNCSSGAQGQFGWYVALPGSNGDSATVNGQTVPIGEQILFDPQLTTDGELVVNTYIPALATALICNPAPPTGFTMALEPDTGEQSPTPYFNVAGTSVSGVQNNGVGVPLEVASGTIVGHDAEYLITQTVSGQAAKPTLINRHRIVMGQRLSWVQRR